MGRQRTGWYVAGWRVWLPGLGVGSPRLCGGVGQSRGPGSWLVRAALSQHHEGSGGVLPWLGCVSYGRCDITRNPVDQNHTRLLCSFGGQRSQTGLVSSPSGAPGESPVRPSPASRGACLPGGAALLLLSGELPAPPLPFRLWQPPQQGPCNAPGPAGYSGSSPHLRSYPDHTCRDLSPCETT